jgi:histone H2A
MAQGKADPQTVAKTEHGTKNIIKLSQIKRIMKDKTRMRISKPALVAVSAILIYLVGEIIEGAKSVASTEDKKKITPRHINNAIYNDSELNFIGHDWLIKSGGMKSSIISGDISSKKSTKD